MNEETSIARWIADLRAGHSLATARLWERYYERLVRLAAQKLRSAPRRVADEEDVVVAAFDSFCRGAQAGRFPQLDDHDDLWQVLVLLTARKVCRHLQRERRQKRGGGAVRHASALDVDDMDAVLDATEGTPPAMLKETVKRAAVGAIDRGGAPAKGEPLGVTDADLLLATEQVRALRDPEIVPGSIGFRERGYAD